MGTAGCDANQLAYKDISFRACDVNAGIDICPTEAKALSGGGTEFAAKLQAPVTAQAIQLLITMEPIVGLKKQRT
ncbi:MAG: hypothetical protein GY874_03325 [Desulfobacteraceae bacterium]|nr:hypothetical protein [Desulfobacteraceae bacterium]